MPVWVAKLGETYLCFIIQAYKHTIIYVFIYNARMDICFNGYGNGKTRPYFREFMKNIRIIIYKAYYYIHISYKYLLSVARCCELPHGQKVGYLHLKNNNNSNDYGDG